MRRTRPCPCRCRSSASPPAPPRLTPPAAGRSPPGFPPSACTARPPRSSAPPFSSKAAPPGFLICRRTRARGAARCLSPRNKARSSSYFLKLRSCRCPCPSQRLASALANFSGKRSPSATPCTACSTSALKSYYKRRARGPSRSAGVTGRSCLRRCSAPPRR